MSHHAAPAAARPGVTAGEQELFGHPKGLTFLFATEMWERFSYYGMRALLVLYLAKYLLLPPHAGHVIGLASFKSALEALQGPLAPQPFSSEIYGLYTGLVYLTPIFGGLLADRLLGQRRTVIIGAVLMAIGHFMMASESLLLVALAALILGNGAFKPNISTQVGGLYEEGDSRRDRAYLIFYVGINLGAFLSPLVCGTLGEEAGWHWGFGAAGVGMLAGLAIYLYGFETLPPDELAKAKARRRARQPLGRGQWQAIIAILILFLPATLFWAAYEQQGNTIALWASDYTNRSISLFFWHIEIPATLFQSFNPFMIFAFTPLIVWLWEEQARSRREPSTIVKMGLGCLGVALANLVMAAAALRVVPSAAASPLWLTAYFIILTVGELYLSPTSLSFISKVAPPQVLSLMMGVWLATSFTGNLLAGWLGGYWSVMDKGAFFGMIAAIAALAGAIILMASRPLNRMLSVD